MPPVAAKTPSLKFSVGLIRPEKPVSGEEKWMTYHVVVQGNRIAAAACFLPLSVNPRVSRELGTRHRAALGLTEENDAVAIVVSEESGAISLAMGGSLERGVEGAMLRRRLETLLNIRQRNDTRPREARSRIA